MITYRNPLLRAAAQDIASLPVDPDEATVGFDVVAAEFGIELWPLPEFSHDQFMRERDHAGWLEGLEVKLIEVRTEQSRRKPPAKRTPKKRTAR